MRSSLVRKIVSGTVFATMAVNAIGIPAVAADLIKYAPDSHTHACDYSASGDTLTAECTDPSCQETTKVQITAEDALCDGSGHGAQLTGQAGFETFTGVTLDPGTIRYYESNGSSELGTAPSSAGKYRAEFSVILAGTDYTITTTYSIKMCELTFEMNGHGEQVAKQELKVNGVPERPADPSEEGCLFGGWYTDNSFDTEFDFYSGVKGDVKAYAKWTVNKYTVSFDINGHGTAPADQTVEHGQKVTKPDDPAEDGYVFTGWYTDIDCNNAYDFQSPAKADLTLYAGWDTESYKVTFDANGHGTAPAAQTVKYGETAARPEDPEDAGYEFDGWYTDLGLTSEYDFSSKVTKDITVYASWKIKSFEVKFDVQGKGTAPASQKIEYGSKAQRPADPSYDGFEFGGWYTDAACNDSYDFSKPVTASMTVYAKWTGVTYKVTDGMDTHRMEGSEADLTITVERSINDDICFDKFVSLEIDGVQLLRDSDYRADKGSLVVTILGSYLKDLDEGTHQIKFIFEDGEAETTVIIDDSGEDPDEPTATPTDAPDDATPTPTPTDTPAADDQTPTPTPTAKPDDSGVVKTGESDTGSVWIAMILISSSILMLCFRWVNNNGNNYKIRIPKVRSK
ncbi:MAG: InlB B-repeat-containing protein [Clostridiales bacterium]|nr:InlB B-repeat-containing protein [Clostridiales bacterium]